MLNKITSTKRLPYKLYVATLLPNDVDLEKYSDLDGYLLVTKSPKMTILFLEYEEGQYNKVSKEIWKRVQYISKNQQKEEF